MRIIDAIFQEDLSIYTTHLNRQVFGRVLLLGLVNGVATWLLGLALHTFMLVPTFCHEGGETVALCVNSVMIGNYIALVLVGMMSVPIFAMLRIRRAIIVSAALTAVLWGVGVWTNGPWFVSLALTSVTFSLMYAAMVWINRIRGHIGALLILGLFVLLARVVLHL